MLIVLGISFISLLFCIIKDIFIGYGLTISLIALYIYLLINGYSFKSLFKYIFDGAKKSYVILLIFLLIGSITALWMTTGTIPSFVYYGIKYMNPSYFYLYIFIITALVSSLLGTAFGTIVTVGVAFIIIAREGNTNIAMATGAIISGVFVGDRCSFMSSGALLIANITNTEIRTNVINMLKTSVIPFILTCLGFYFLSINNLISFHKISLNHKN
jgi:NhaC family Na+:H+ antiporter